LSNNVLQEAIKIYQQLFRVLTEVSISFIDDENQNWEIIEKSITAGLIENLMESCSGYSYRRVKDKKDGFYIHPSSVTFDRKPKYFVAAEIMKTSQTYARFIQEVKPQWLQEFLPQSGFIKEKSQETQKIKEELIETNSFQKARSLLQEKAQEKLKILPSYKVLMESGIDHKKNFMVGVYLGSELIGAGEGDSKQSAASHAAEMALENKGWKI